MCHVLCEIRKVALTFQIRTAARYWRALFAPSALELRNWPLGSIPQRLVYQINSARLREDALLKIMMIRLGLFVSMTSHVTAPLKSVKRFSGREYVGMGVALFYLRPVWPVSVGDNLFRGDLRIPPIRKYSQIRKRGKPDGWYRPRW